MNTAATSQQVNAGKLLNFIQEVLVNMPQDWLRLTTHRLDIYNEEAAKTQFVEHFEDLFNANVAEAEPLKNLPTAYDYIRLGHPLSSILEWTIAHLNNVKAENVVSFSSRTMPILAILRKNAADHKNTRIVYTGDLPSFFDADILRQVYKYSFELKQVGHREELEELSAFNGTSVYLSQEDQVGEFSIPENIDFFVSMHASLGSVLVVNHEQNGHYVSQIQHVRRRESIAMTPVNCYTALKAIAEGTPIDHQNLALESNKASVQASIAEITGTTSKALVGSSGLSVQYAIMMGLIHDALENHQGKAIKFIVPPNCYGGTNDQARRVAAAIDTVEVVDLPVDGDHDMVQSIDTVLTKVAAEDAVPFIIAEIPTNPRVEVPDLNKLKATLLQERKTATGNTAIDPVFILDQTFCPNVHFLGEGEILSEMRAISYASGSKFPSGGLCTAGYCVGNAKTEALLEKIQLHLQLCDNEATAHQMEILAEQLPSMEQRIHAAYLNTRAFVNFIKANLPNAKINFVSEELAEQGFTPSVFSLDLPTKGNTDEEREAFKRALNLKLIQRMITEIPHESKYCVSYGQLKGCYWTIPATSTQGTTKEGDKDYIARIALSPEMDLDLHKKVFLDFVRENGLNEIG